MPRSSQSRMREKVSAPITSAVRAWPDAQEVVGGGQGVGEAGADRLQVEGDGRADAELALHRGRGGREGVVGGRGGDQDQVEVRGRQPGPVERLARGRDGEIGGQLALGREMALADAGALADPFVRGVDRPRQLVIAHHPRRQIGADAAHDRSQHARSGAAAAWPAGRGPGDAAHLLDDPLVGALADQIGRDGDRRGEAHASVPPWLFTTTPFRPRNMAPL